MLRKTLFETMLKLSEYSEPAQKSQIFSLWRNRHINSHKNMLMNASIQRTFCMNLHGSERLHFSGFYKNGIWEIDYFKVGRTQNEIKKGENLGKEDSFRSFGCRNDRRVSSNAEYRKC